EIGRDDPIEFVAGCPGLRTVSGLTFQHGALGDVRLAVLLASPHLLRLRELNHRVVGLTQASIPVLAGAECLASLRVLHLTGSFDNRPDFGPLLDSPVLANLEELSLADIGLGDEGIAQLVASRQLGRLKRLDLAAAILSDSSIPRLTSWPGIA